MIAIFILVLVAAVESQYFSMPGFKPDITFNENNDRFDIKPLIYLQKKYLNSLNSGRRSHRVGHRGGSPREHRVRREWIALKGDKTEGRGEAEKIMQRVKENVNKEMDNIAQLLSHAWIRSHDGRNGITNNDNHGEREAHVDEFVTNKSLNNIFINLGGRRAGNILGSDSKRDTIFNYAFPIQMVLRGYLLTPPLVQ